MVELFRRERTVVEQEGAVNYRELNMYGLEGLYRTGTMCHSVVELLYATMRSVKSVSLKASFFSADFLSNDCCSSKL